MLKLILIDDDQLIREAWAFVAKNKGDSLYTFESFKAFLEHSQKLSADHSVYIDWSMDTKKNLLHFIENLLNLGFINIHITTGHSVESIQKIKGVKSIVEKKYP